MCLFSVNFVGTKFIFQLYASPQIISISFEIAVYKIYYHLTYPFGTSVQREIYLGTD